MVTDGETATSVDTYWFDHDYFKVSDRFHFYFEHTDYVSLPYTINREWRQSIEERI